MRRFTLTFALLLVVLGTAAGDVRGQDIGIALGAVPPAAALEDLDGKPVQLSDYTGKKPVLIEFWATWCPVCAALDPHIAAVKRQYADRLDVLYIGVGVNQTPRSILRHLEQHPLSGPVLFDRQGAATRALQAPTTSYIVVLDADGKVVYTGAGEDQDLAAAVARAIR